ncbi:hypothetical protein BJY24_001516 [Nocardia transvalensis]|uniref:Uncharacterized protein n=1 Tax=Nocardia transvalensis TaxID=37333 RepID=A0A7W9UGU1_9NOCA|nr:hypothetical protein [Nocardia transvalensis]MBB5912649.1 hypothetical protein [Nocardia transvalensis]
MATIGQLRAALAILHAEVDEVAQQVWSREMAGSDTAAVEHAMLAGLLYRLMGADLRHSLTSAPDIATLEDRARAAGPSAVSMSGEDLCAQAHFEAYWLTDRIAELFGDAETVPAPLAAAAHTAEAARTLLRIHRELAEGVRFDAGHAGWTAVLDQLDRARALARAAHAAAETAPQHGLVQPG